MSLKTKIKILCFVAALLLSLSSCIPKPQFGDAVESESTSQVFNPATDDGGSSDIGKKYGAVAELVESGEKLTVAVDTDFEYEVVADGVKITKYTGAYKSESADDYIILIIPETIAGKSVVSIGKEAFAIVAHLDAIVIPNSVTVIENLAFYGCSYLTYVKFGDRAKQIGDYSFAMCPSLYNVDISSADKIGIGAFIGCDSLNTITLPFVGGGSEDNSYLGYIFGASSVEFNKEFVPGSLRKIILNDKVTNIPDLAFYKCQYITSVVIPDSVLSIGVRAFYKCRSIVEIDTGSGVKTIADDAFFGCDNLKSIKLGSALESLGMQAFFGCADLESVNIPANLTEIKASTFYGCTSLKGIDLANVKAIGKDAFGGCEDLIPPDILRVENIAEGNDNLYKH